MDGYIPTKRMKSDPRFTGIPVIMHSSLPACPTRSRAVGRQDEYVPKFEPRLSETPGSRRLLGSVPVQGCLSPGGDRRDMVENKNLLIASRCLTRPPGPKKMEIPLFSLGTNAFGINVFKVREVDARPHHQDAQYAPGVTAHFLRGNVIPVLSAGPFLQLEGGPVAWARP